jgi:4-amino-4-deoxy-L-arabinose transferase-like glycosyltransferase
MTAATARRVAVPATLAALAAGLRLPGVWQNALSQDEVASARILREATVPGMLHHVVRTESTPPLWYTLGWLAHHAGVPIVEVRLLSVLFGALLAALVYELARTVVRPALAAVAGALVAVGYQPVYHGSELRSYELLALLATLLCFLVLRHAEQPSRRLELALGATVWAGLLTHYFFVYSVVGVLAWLWLDPGARAVRRRATVAIGAAGICAAPWFPAFLVQYGHDRFWWIGAFKPRVVLKTPARLFVPYAGGTLTLSIVVLLLAAAGAIVLARSSRGRLVALLALLPTAIAGTAWAAGERTYAVRNLIETAPFLAVAFAAPLAFVRRRAAIAAVAAAAVAAVAVVVVRQSSVPLPPFQRIAKALVAEGWRPSDPVAVFGNVFSYRAPLEWYLPRQPLLDVSHPTGHACSSLFLVRRRGDDFSVRRLRDVRPDLRHATLLASMRTPPACVRLSTNPRLEPLA